MEKSIGHNSKISKPFASGFEYTSGDNSGCHLNSYKVFIMNVVVVIVVIVVVIVGDTNPYQTEATSAEFFSCGFLQHTYIFVAESLVDEVS